MKSLAFPSLASFFDCGIAVLRILFNVLLSKVSKLTSGSKVSRIGSIPLNQNKLLNNSGGKTHRALHYTFNKHL